MLQWLFGLDDTDEDMRRAKAAPVSQVKIDAHVAKLKLAVRDARAFQLELENLSGDKALTAAEVMEIARIFVGSNSARSRRAAISAIAQERLRIAHADAKADSARKARVW